MFRYWAKNWVIIIVVLVGLLPLLDAALVDASRSRNARFETRVVGAAMWIVISAGTATLIVTFFVRAKDYRATRRRAAGLCPACGYDLRASKDRCPECGQEITQ